MIYETHLMLALLSSVYGVSRGYFSPDFALALGMLAGTLLPDIDTPKSKLGRKLRPFSDMLSWVAGHRGLVHSLAGMVVFTIPFLIISAWLPGVAKAFVMGYLLHLLLDSLTPSGIQWLYPAKLKIRGPVKTGSLWEKLIFVVLLYLAVRIIY